MADIQIIIIRVLYLLDEILNRLSNSSFIERSYYPWNKFSAKKKNNIYRHEMCAQSIEY